MYLQTLNQYRNFSVAQTARSLIMV